MRKPPLLILFLALSLNLLAQTPHGKALKIDCAACHSSAGWEMVLDSTRFNHNSSTNFALAGRHKDVECKKCHESLVFTDAGLECISCHTDVHNQTLGTDCARCHSANNWLVDNITTMHFNSGFPLLGKHLSASCTDCHVSESALRFERIGNDCATCHLEQYLATTSPNHPGAGYSTSCTDCHSADGSDWSAQNISHDFFPLTGGHDIGDCTQCHTGGTYSGLSQDCAGCHTDDYNATTNPNHAGLHFSTDCKSCHTTSPDWMPAEYGQHDADYFPIYSGKHKGEWVKCSDCHTNPANFSEFSCVVCHLNPETNNEHGGISGYTYSSTACLACHPTGDGDGSFNHNNTNFPLKGAHTSVACASCHTNGYQGTPTQCVACHQADYNSSNDPNHISAGFPTDCASCHSENAWAPANFNHDGQYFPIYSGKHKNEWDKCSDCHTTPGNFSVFSCIVCHNNQNGLANEHNDVSGYSYSNAACFNCHPDGN